MTLPIDIREVLICDDIRREDNGKAILIGVYYGNILLPNFPAEMRLSFWLQGITSGSIGGKIKFKFALMDQNGVQQSEPSFVETVINNQNTSINGAVLVLAGLPINIIGPGMLTVSVEDADTWIELTQKKIDKLELTSSSIEMQLPS